LFSLHYGPPGSGSALHAARAWTNAISQLGDYYHDLFQNGHVDVTYALRLEEANLLRARDLAVENGWHELVIGSMQGLRCLYEHTGRSVEWRRLVSHLITEFTNPATEGPLPGLAHQWKVLSSYRIRIARRDRDWRTAERVQQKMIDECRKQAMPALAKSPATLDDDQRHDIHDLAVANEQLGQLLYAQDDPNCIKPYMEAMELCRRIDDARGEGTLAFSLGNAYVEVPRLRDLDQAEHWYEYRLMRLEDYDTVGRASVLAQLGSVSYQRFLEDSPTETDSQKLLRHLIEASAAYQRALSLFPTDAVDERAVIHSQLGVIFHNAGNTREALVHYQQAIQYRERQGNRYAAGQARFNVALALARSGQPSDALLYAQAALRDYEAVGAGAAAKADLARQLIAALQQGKPV
jgi:tetratricopeptide (TPR) repeat protein